MHEVWPQELNFENFQYVAIFQFHPKTYKYNLLPKSWMKKVLIKRRKRVNNQMKWLESRQQKLNHKRDDQYPKTQIEGAVVYRIAN